MNPVDRYIATGREYIKIGELAKEFCDKVVDPDFDRNEWVRTHRTLAPMDKVRDLVIRELKYRIANHKYRFKLRMELFGCFTVFGKK